MGNDLDDLLRISDRIVDNLRALKTIVPTSEIAQKQQEITQDLARQQTLLNRTGITDATRSDDRNIRSVTINLRLQREYTSQLGLNQTNNSGIIDQTLQNISNASTISDGLIRTTQNTTTSNQTNSSRQISTSVSNSSYPRSDPDYWRTAEFFIKKTASKVNREVSEQFIDSGVPFLVALGKITLKFS